MSVNPGTQSLAQQAIKDYANLAGQINSILLSIIDLKARESTLSYSVIFTNTQTYSLNADGSGGITDGTINLAHPMLNQTVSANQVSAFTGYVVNDLFNFLTGVIGPTVADRRPAIHGILP